MGLSRLVGRIRIGMRIDDGRSIDVVAGYVYLYISEASRASEH